MKIALTLFAIAIVINTIAPLIAYSGGAMDFVECRNYILANSALWFVFVPLALKSREQH